ncbi:MBL fold metallo-hydrolase [Caldanaerobius polysaccharolyticus]|uniref:MBL fold metallo-hydrolase n=1 Tax=Caldanaerobius polysaccharolyticus TaxID=44256 RepID=UPI00047B34C2|nr:MBL fold metallo-hydrolase [Caldanaerobius polysaccharolyticus]
MKIKHIAHSCFYIEADGKRIVTDPFDSSLGFSMPEIYADIVTSSHGHFDHNYIEGIKGNPESVTTSGDHNVKGVDIVGVQVFHDKEKGAIRGINNVYVFKGLEGINVCHMGDLGHILSFDDLQAIGPVDVLMIPVGGYFTIEPDEAVYVTKQINPKIVIPMHYSSEETKKHKEYNLPIKPVDEFLNLIGDAQFMDELVISKGVLPEKMQVVVLKEQV